FSRHTSRGPSHSPQAPTDLQEDCMTDEISGRSNKIDVHAGPMTPRGNLMYHDDGTLVRLALTGEQEASNILAQRYHKPVERLIHKMIGSRELEADLVQDTFLKAWRNLEKFDQSQPFQPWLMEVARNIANDHLRKKRRREVPVAWDSPSDPE